MLRTKVPNTTVDYYNSSNCLLSSHELTTIEHFNHSNFESIAIDAIQTVVHGPDYYCFFTVYIFSRIINTIHIIRNTYL